MLRETKWGIILDYPSSHSTKDKDYQYGGKKIKREGEKRHLEKKTTHPNSLNKSLFFPYIYSLSLPVSLEGQSKS